MKTRKTAARPATPARSRDWPIYHLTAQPDEGTWMPGDPNGAIYWKGRYHVMYIYQDHSQKGREHCWGHFSSPDLIHWTLHPPCLVPREGDADTGTFSGNAFVNKDGHPMLCWFGLGPKAGVCVATAEDDDLIAWKKHPANPIIPCPKEGEPDYNKYRVWDPYLWLEGDTYYCLLGGNKLPNGRDTLYTCTSKDLVNWKKIGPFYEGNPEWREPYEDCSCPDFFRLRDKHVLLCISHGIGARCYIGRFDRKHDRFEPEQHVRMNWRGGMFFAPESLLDNKGRRMFWAWVTDPRTSPARAEGSGFQSLPRVMDLDEDGRLRINPPRELTALRRRHRRLENITIKHAETIELKGITGRALELDFDVDASKCSDFGVLLRCSPDEEEKTLVWLVNGRGSLTVDASRSSKNGTATYSSPPFMSYGMPDAKWNPHPYPSFEAPFALEKGERLRLRIFLDGYLLEAFANGRQCVTQMIFPARPDSLRVKAAVWGGEAVIRSVDAWDMGPIPVEDRRRG